HINTEPDDRGNAGGDRGFQPEARLLRGTGLIANLARLGRVYPPREHGEEGYEPDQNIDDKAGQPVHVSGRSQAGRIYSCSSSIRVPQKSLGSRNSPGLPGAPVFGSPSPITRAPSAFRRSRAAARSSTS